MRRVNPQMVRLARESRGKTQSQVAESTGIHQGAISRLELGTIELADDKLNAIAADLKYPTSFFYQDEEYTGLGLSVVFYRKKASTLIKHMRQIEAATNIYRIHAKTLLRDVTLSMPNDFRVIDIEELNGDAKAVAQMTRANWKLPPGPVKNLVALIESAGGIVFRFPFGTRDIDAMSQWLHDTPPLFFINSEADNDRARFSLAHELGHMVMHQQVSETMEDEANCFAAEFLMPEKDIKQELFGMTIERSAKLKLNWRVSMAALIKRSHDLGCLAPQRYASTYAYYSRLGYRRKEPCPIEAEHPRVIKKLIDAHATHNGFTKDDFGRMLHLLPEEAEEKYLRSDAGLRIAS